LGATRSVSGMDLFQEISKPNGNTVAEGGGP